MKNKIGHIFCLALLALFSQTQIVAAQSLDDLRKQYPDEKAVFLNRVFSYDITLKEDKPCVESHETQQLAFLTQNAAAYMSGYSFSHSSFHQLVSYNAFTRSADGKTLRVSNFKTSTSKQSFVFYDDVKETSFNFPAVEAGAVGSLDVTWHNTDPHLLSPYYFTSYIPVANSELQVTVANDIVLKYYKLGLDTGQIKVTVNKGRKSTLYTFVYKHCPADQHYDDAPSYAWYSPHVVFCIEKYKDKSGNTISYMANADDLYNLNFSYVKSGNAMIDPSLKHLTDSITTQVKTPEEKARNIYKWVQHNIKYVAFEDGMGGFVPRDAALVYNRRFGDCKDMSSILKQMMNLAGIPAYYTWIGTRHLPYKFSQTPLPLVSNHMICTIQLDGRYIYLDGTDPTCVFGMPSSHIQGKEAMIGINDKTYKVETVPVPDKERNLFADTTWVQVTPDGINGQIKQELRGYFASEAYGKLMYWREKDMNEHMKNEFSRGTNRFKLDTFFIDRTANNNQIVLKANFSLPGYGKKIDDEYYLNLNLFRFFENQKIDFPKRATPIEQDFKFIKKYVTILELPKGYKINYLPKGNTFRNSACGISINYEQKGNKIILTQEYDNNDLLLTADKFDAWNKALDNLFAMYKETLSFSKL